MPTANDRLNGNCNKVWGLIKLPFRNSCHNNNAPHATTNFKSSCERGSNGQQSKVTSSGIARVLIPTRRRLRLEPPNKFYFPYEPGKQVQSAIKIKNTSKSHVAFKFQTTAPKSCFMRPPGAILAPGESIIATVFRFVEPPEKNEKPTDRKKKVKYRIMSLKVNAEKNYVPELFDEQKDLVVVEQILQVVFLDATLPSPALEKLRRQLAEAEAALEAHEQPPEDTWPKIVGDGPIIDEWKLRRERYMARQLVKGEDFV